MARARGDLAIVLDVRPPAREDVRVDLRARGLRASLTSRAADVEGQLRRFVARYVAREIEKPYVLAARTIDVAGVIDRALTTLGPRRPDPDAVVAELDEALAEEISAADELFADPGLYEGG